MKYVNCRLIFFFLCLLRLLHALSITNTTLKSTALKKKHFYESSSHTHTSQPSGPILAKLTLEAPYNLTSAVRLHFAFPKIVSTLTECRRDQIVVLSVVPGSLVVNFIIIQSSLKNAKKPHDIYDTLSRAVLKKTQDFRLHIMEPYKVSRGNLTQINTPRPPKEKTIERKKEFFRTEPKDDDPFPLSDAYFDVYNIMSWAIGSDLGSSSGSTNLTEKNKEGSFFNSWDYIEGIKEKQRAQSQSWDEYLKKSSETMPHPTIVGNHSSETPETPFKDAHSLTASLFSGDEQLESNRTQVLNNTRIRQNAISTLNSGDLNNRRFQTTQTALPSTRSARNGLSTVDSTASEAVESQFSEKNSTAVSYFRLHQTGDVFDLIHETVEPLATKQKSIEHELPA